jgi:hypothetical protein
MAIEDRYLGDGVYASYDGYAIVLALRGQDNTTRIALEPAVLVELQRFQRDIAAAKNGMVSPQKPSKPV